jgi:hypothetical protein
MLLDLIYAIAGLGLRGLDLEAVPLGGSREEAPDRMFLRIRGFHDLGQGRPLGPSDQFQDLCALALGARRAGFLGVGGFGLLAGPGFLLPGVLGFALGFLALGCALLQGGSSLLRGGLSRRNVRALRPPTTMVSPRGNLLCPRTFALVGFEAKSRRISPPGFPHFGEAFSHCLANYS